MFTLQKNEHITILVYAKIAMIINEIVHTDSYDMRKKCRSSNLVEAMLNCYENNLGRTAV